MHKQQKDGNKFQRRTKKVYNVIVNMTDAFIKKDIDAVLATYEDGAIVIF